MKKRRILLGLALASLFTFSLSACDENKLPTDPTADTGETGTGEGQGQSGSGEGQGQSGSGEGQQADPVVENYKVYFNSNGGTAVAAATVKKGEKVTKPTDPTRTSAVSTHEFGGWFTDAACTTAYDFNTAVNADVTLYAKWTSTLVEASKITMNNVEYDTIKAAIQAVPTDSTDTYTIIIPKGTHTENGLEYNGKATIKLVGATDAKYGADVIIKGHGSDMTAEKTRNLVGIQGTGDIILENLTLVSDWGRENHGSNTQAEVLGTDTKGNTIAYNCGFKSNQDTLRTAGKAWFYGCYIEGDVDFIWMEQAGSVALYEKCEIVSVYDATASSHASYVTAPRMAISTKAGKGLVIYNSTVKESDEAKENGQTTYLGRSPWTSGYFSQVAYINTTCSDIEVDGWYKNPIPSEYDRKVIGWKMDQATASTLNNYAGTDILDETTVANEFSGRRTILNRLYNCGKLKYEKDANTWDIDAVIAANGFAVDYDFSSDTLEGETAGEPVVYKFDGSQELTGVTVENFNAHSSGSVQGGNGASITVPVSGKCYVEVYGFYAGTVETKADTQGEAVMFFNNGSTSAEVVNTYTVYDENATSVTVSAKATTYITKIVVTPDTGIENVAVTSLDITASTKLECVGVPVKLTANITPANATNKSIKWSSSAPDVADVDTYTGKVTFKKAGTVTFTASTCDGSEKTATITCNPINPTWTKAEWYTTDSTLDAETGAQEIGNFDVTTSEACSLNTASSFTNLAGTDIETQKGIKFNSKGLVNVSTTKGNAYLTVMVATRISKGAFLSTVEPSVFDSADPNTKAQLVSVTGTKTTYNEGDIITYTYFLPKAATWSITRGDGNVECSPLVYASVAYETRITKNTFVNYKGGTYSATGTGATVYNHNNDVDGSRVDSTAEVTYDNVTYTGAVNNGNDNWLKINQGATIKFEVADKCKLLMYFYKGQNNVTVTLGGTAITSTTAAQTADTVAYEYDLTGAGEVVITSTANNTYIGAFEIVYPSNAVTENTGLVFYGDSIPGMTNNVVKWSSNKTAGTEGKFTISGSYFTNSNYLEFKQDDKIVFDLDFDTTLYDAVITISSYNDVASTVSVGTTNLTVTKDEVNSSSQNFIYTAIASSKGAVTIGATTAQNYLNYITITLVAKN